MTSTKLRIVKKDDRFPSFSGPVIIGYYSIGTNGEFIFSKKNLKYLSRVQHSAKYDLNIGFENYVSKPESLENEVKIDSLLMWLFHSQYLRNLCDPEDTAFTFVCFRGLLTTVMRTPYEQQEDWFISAIKIKNVVFMCSFHTEDKKAKIQKGQTEKERRFEFWGRKFEQYMLSDDPRKKPDVSSSVNANEEFSLVLRTKLNGHNIVYGAETDGITSSKLTDPELQLLSVNCSQFVELKTSRIIQNSHQDHNFKKFKLLKWWSQSYMAGIENIICGFRNDDGIVLNTKNFKTADIPQKVQNLWSPRVCLRFLEDFLNFVKEILMNEPELSQWRFDWKPSWTQVTAQKMLQRDTYKIIPDWFYNECKTFSVAH